MTPKSCQKGLSLIQVMVALGLTGVLTLVIMQNMEIQNKASKKATLDANILEARKTISDVLGRSEPCVATFVGKRRGENITEIKLSEDLNSTNIYAETGKEYRSSGMMIKEIRILTLQEEEKYLDANPDRVDSNGIGQATVRIIFERMNKGQTKAYFGADTINAYIPIIAEWMEATSVNVTSTTTQAQCEAAFDSQITTATAALDAQITAAGFNPANYPVALLTTKTQVCALPYPSMGSQNRDILYAHVMEAVSDCGNRLSN